MLVTGLGFPIGMPIPTAVRACGDGVHAVEHPRRGHQCWCVCGEFFVEVHHLVRSVPDRIVIADQSMDDLPNGATRDCRYADGTAREVPA